MQYKKSLLCGYSIFCFICERVRENETKRQREREKERKCVFGWESCGVVLPCRSGRGPWHSLVGARVRRRRSAWRRRSAPASAEPPPCCLDTSPSYPTSQTPAQLRCPLKRTTTHITFNYTSIKFTFISRSSTSRSAELSTQIRKTTTHLQQVSPLQHATCIWRDLL